MIKREVVDEILMRNDIESLIGSYVSLKRAGSNLKGLCPFHSEKTPSFTVYPAENSFYCFGCGKGGNAITFVREIEHLDYPDAIEFLAKRAGITVLLEDEKKLNNKDYVSRQRMYEMNRDAARFFHYSLFADNPKAKEALSYFVDKRKLSLATIKHFGLGFAPDSYDSLMKYMLAKGYNKDELVVAYLLGRTDKGHYYDAFRNRVMFPIIDTTDNVIAFGGRVMDDSKPKYKNTMDTPVFKKSRNLFALNFARHSDADNFILCEGYMDVIALHAAGFTNAVATLGTAITPEQARVMSKYQKKKVIISYDADEAGQKAAQKAIRLLEEVGLEVGVIKTPDAKDPDEYIKTYGKEKFAEVVSGSKSKFEYNMDAVLHKYDINLPQDRINAINDIEILISDIYSKAERDIYISYVSKKFDIKRESIKADVDRIVSRRTRTARKDESKKLIQEASGYSDRVNPDFAKAPVVATAEENLLGLLLLYREHRQTVFEENLLAEDDFFTELGRRVFSYVRNLYYDENSTPDMDSVFSTDEIGRITKMKLHRMELEKNGDDVLKEAISALKTTMQKNSASSVSTLDELNNLLGKLRSKDGN